MSNAKDLPKSFGDIEKPHETAADSFSDGLDAAPFTVRLGVLWSGLTHVADEQRDDSEAPPRSPSALPILDDMKGILQWD